MAFSCVSGGEVHVGTMGALLDLGMEIKDQRGNAGTLICEHAYVYAAEVTNGF